MPAESNEDRLIKKQDRLLDSADNRVLELETEIMFLQGQIGVLISQSNAVATTAEMQESITQIVIDGANRVNQEMASKLVAANQEIRRLKEILEGAGIEVGDNHRLGN